MPSKQAIKEFQEIYRKTYGKEISFAEAEVQANALMSFVRAVVGPNKPGKKYVHAKKRDN